MSPGSRIGKYRLVRRIGRGAMGEVWEAENVDTDRRVALKLITSPDPELRMRLLREARAIGRLDHPNIVQILDRGETDAGEPFLVMQLLRGETLADRLHRDGRLPEPVAAGIALDVSRALRVAHEKDIIHRDLKPANIFLHMEPDAEEHVVKVVDFGVSKLSIENEGGATLTGNLVGSPAYMSPEQIRSVGVDGRTDVWAVGVLLFEMLAGERPFSGEQAVAVLTKILTQTAPRVEVMAPGVTPALADVIAACLEREPSQRIASANELSRRLRLFAPRGRLPTLQDAAAPERFAAIPEPPRAQAPPAHRLQDEAEDSDAATAVFQPDALLRAAIAAPQAATGTVLMTGRAVPPPAARQRDTATALYTPPRKAEQNPASIDDERPTNEMVVRPPPPPAPPPRAPMPSAPTSAPRALAPSQDFGSGSWPNHPASRAPMPSAPTSAPRAPAPPAPSQDFGSGSWPNHPASHAPEPVDTRGGGFDAQAAFGGTQPLSPAVLAQAAVRDFRKETLKLDPNVVPRSPLASANSPSPADGAVESGPMAEPLAPPTPTFDPMLLMDEPPPRRGLPLVLLGVSALALAVVLTMLVLTIMKDRPEVPATPQGATSATAPAH